VYGCLLWTLCIASVFCLLTLCVVVLLLLKFAVERREINYVICFAELLCKLFPKRNGGEWNP